MEPSAAPLDTTPDPAIVQPPGANPPGAPREQQQQQQQQQQEQLRIGESGQFSEGLEDREYRVVEGQRKKQEMLIPASIYTCGTAHFGE
ncbi:hypothetical protein TURU_163439 [Turdus rufiventris]|nr:hypothetical protein TURU_163439 [Turdus rufiventris]